MKSGLNDNKREQSCLKQLNDEQFVHRLSEIVLFACIRNEHDRLPYFLQYYRELGIEKFVIVDNDSDDGSTDYLLDQEDCFVFWTDQTYSSSRCGIDWINELLDRFSLDRWVLIVDADELLVYPNCENTGIREFVDHLEDSSATALQTFLLDMYSDDPIKDTEYTRGDSFIATCPYFDLDSYSYTSDKGEKGIPVRGGVRKRLFWRDDSHRGKPPVLVKTPLVKWSSGTSLEASTHIMRNVAYSKTTGALLHFKLFSDFYHRAELESKRGEHWDDGAQYDVYWKVLSEKPDLNPMYSGSVKYRGSEQLCDLDLIRRQKSYPLVNAQPDGNEVNNVDESDYFIRSGYRHNMNARPYCDTEEDSQIYQLNVYEFAKQQIIANHIKSVVDLGCGHAMKLEKLILPVCRDITGIDWKHSIDFCRKNHNFGTWIIDNMEEPAFEFTRTFDLVICADVIEHLFYPDRFFDYLKRFSHDETLVVLSTPERDLRRGKDSMGPPDNPAHVREWNMDELESYLKSKRLDVLDHRIVELREGMFTCQLAFFRNCGKAG